jgi:hypothetical protein
MRNENARTPPIPDALERRCRGGPAIYMLTAVQGMLVHVQVLEPWPKGHLANSVCMLKFTKPKFGHLNALS